MSKKDYYNILNVNKDSTEDDIKKSYKKLALQYHPDKNQGNEEACEKFKEISEAYSVLKNKDKRSQYDMMGSVGEDFGMDDPFSVFNDIFKQHMGSFMNMRYDNDVNIGNVFSNVSGFPESSFPFGNIHVKVHTFPVSSNTFEENIINDFTDSSPNLGSIINNLFNKKKGTDKVKEKKILYNKPDNIIYNINVSFADIYNLVKKNISIKRIKKKDGKYIEKIKKINIPIYGKEILLEGYGDQLKDYKECGDVIINIFNNKDDNFKRINEYDMLTSKEIFVNQLYTSFIYEIILPHGEVIKVQTQQMLNKDYYVQRIKNKGLPYEDENKKLLYGNLYVMYKIKFPETFTELKNLDIYNETGSINDNYHTAYNCNLDEIFSQE
jgi:DnaJ-class molecular chaperone